MMVANMRKRVLSFLLALVLLLGMIPVTTLATEEDTVPPTTEAPAQEDTVPPTTEAPGQEDSVPPTTETPGQEDTVPPTTETPEQEDTVPPTTETPEQEDTIPPTTEEPGEEDTTTSTEEDVTTETEDISLLEETDQSASSRVEKLVSEMSLRDKITQMMMVDFRKWGSSSSKATDFTKMNDKVRTVIENYNFGSVILFANNIKETEQSYKLTTAMQKAATKDGGIALLIAADQEGGSVYRLGSGTALPGNMALGATYAANGTKYALEAGKIIGSELSAVGINTNLAPVVDVNNNANNPVIGLRSYSDDANMVGQLASASIAGMAQYNVVGTAKHFPGHGDTATDSHYGLPVVNKSRDVLMKTELKPYTVAIDQGVEMIMTAHILYPKLEKDKIVSSKTGKAESLPATMSDDILTDLLKGEMGFKGIVVTDSMTMAGVAANWTRLQSCVIAIQAGVDMLCMPVHLYCQDDVTELDTLIKGIERAVKNGEIPMSRINDAVTRILTVKENRGLLDYKATDYTLEKAEAVVGSDENRAKERELAAAAVTVIKNENNTLPLQLTSKSKVLMLVPYDNERGQMLMAWNRAKEAGLVPKGAQVDYYCFSSSTISAALQKKLDWADTYIINSEVNSTARMNYKEWLSKMPNELCKYAASKGKTAIISSVDKPYDVQMYPKANAIVAAYGCKGSTVDPTEAMNGGTTGSDAAYGPNIIAAVEVILGTYGAQGKLPVNIPVYDAATNSYLTSLAYKRGYGLTYDAKEPIVAFTKQPVGGVIPFGEQFAVNWDVNFVPVKTEIVSVAPDAEEVTALAADATSAQLGGSPEGGYYQIRAYYNSKDFVGSETFCVIEKAAEEIIYTVTFNVDNSQIEIQDVQHGKTVIQPEDPVQEGMVFLGWYTSGDAKYDFSTIVKCDLDLYGKFECAHSYTSTVVKPTYTKQGYTQHTCSACGDSYKSNTTKPTGLPKPNVTGSNASNGDPVLKWTHCSEAKTYYIYRATSKSGTYKKIGSSTTGTYKDTSAVRGKVYYYKVKAIASNSSYNSGYSTYDKLYCKCAAPSISISVSGTTGKPTIKWNKVSGAKKYIIYRATSKNGTYSAIKTTTSTSYKDSSAKPGKTYYYKVKTIASSSNYNSIYSSVKSALCKPAKPVAKIALSSNKPKVSWKKVSGASQYDVYRSTKSSSGFTKIKTTTGTSYVDKSAKKGTTYYYKVVAIKGSARSSYSSAVKIKSK